MPRNPPCTGALQQRLLCNTIWWASENNYILAIHRTFKAVYSERPHNVAFIACYDPSTALTRGVSGVHFKLRNMITMHNVMFIASVDVCCMVVLGAIGTHNVGSIGTLCQWTKTGFMLGSRLKMGHCMLSSQNCNIRRELCMLSSSQTQWTHMRRTWEISLPS